MWLGAEDASSVRLVLSLLGDSDREIVRLWKIPSAVTGPQQWVEVINEIAVVVPGTLAHRAARDPRMPERFRTVAPCFESLGWRSIDGEQATSQLAQVLSRRLLGEAAVREDEVAAAAANAFVAIFGREGQFLTNVCNGDDEESAPKATGSFATACPLTAAIAEAGVVGVGAGLAGLLWCAES